MRSKSPAPRDAISTFFLRNVAPGSVTVDVGCGRGEIALLIARHVPGTRVEGVERDRMWAEAANRRFRRAGYAASLRCRAGDATELRRIFGRMRFDCTIVNNTFHEFWHPVAALREIRTVLKPGGALLLAELTPRVGETVDDCPRYSREKIIELLERGGFRAASSIERSGVVLIRAKKA